MYLQEDVVRSMDRIVHAGRREWTWLILGIAEALGFLGTGTYIVTHVHALSLAAVLWIFLLFAAFVWMSFYSIRRSMRLNAALYDLSDLMRGWHNFRSQIGREDLDRTAAVQMKQKFQRISILKASLLFVSDPLKINLRRYEISQLRREFDRYHQSCRMLGVRAPSYRKLIRREKKGRATPNSAR